MFVRVADQCEHIQAFGIRLRVLSGTLEKGRGKG